MDYRALAAAYEKIEATRKRLEINEHLRQLFDSIRKDPEEVKRVVYMTRGRLGPDYEGVEFGLAEKLAYKAIARAAGSGEKEVAALTRERGDIGLAAEELLAKRKVAPLDSSPLAVAGVFETFQRIARASGEGAQDAKISLLTELLANAAPPEARYLVRTVVGKLRLGVADMALIEGLAAAFASREYKEEIERAYNILPDLGEIGAALARNGLDGSSRLRLKVGVPVRPMLAERLRTMAEVMEKLGGEALLENKYDGLRIQAHIRKGEPTALFSRRLENITSQFPDIAAELEKAFKGKECVVEGEGVPMNLETDEMRPFQEISRRRGRKYGVEEMAAEIPVVIFLFDCIYLDGGQMLDTPLTERRKMLEGAFKKTERVQFSNMKRTASVHEAEAFFNNALADGCEGIMAKSAADASVYQAGARGWLWIKFKREYQAEMADTADLVVVGGFAGRGRRSGWYGALLMAARNTETGAYDTVCKLGTGFTDAMLGELGTRLERFKSAGKPASVNSRMEADTWFEPGLVMEVSGAEITISPVHTCGWGAVRDGAGLAIRFPRFTGRWRDDKGPEEATTGEEIARMYGLQLKRVGDGG